MYSTPLPASLNAGMAYAIDSSHAGTDFLITVRTRLTIRRAG